MRILLLAHRLPYPLESGQHLRLYHLTRHLSQRHEIALVAFGQPPYPPALREVFARIDTCPVPRVQPAGSLVSRLARALDPAEMIPCDPAMADLAGHSAAAFRPDVVWVGGWDMLVYRNRLGPVRVVADLMDDGLLECLREVRRAGGPVRRARAIRRLVQTVRWERRYFRQADVCTFVSSRDAGWARRVVPGLAVEVVENGVDADFFTPAGLDEEFPSLVFEGNQSFPPNADAAGFLVRRVLPEVRRAYPQCRAYIVGRDPAPETRALAAPHVVVTGRVEDVRPYLERASVFVCPMRMGAGIKNKILQAWSMARPVVATRVAAGGLRVAPGENIVLADSARALAGAIRRLLEDDVRRRQIGKQGRETVLACYTWQRQSAAFERVLAGVA
jgi:glycosyltransferase involved in cell wall biosynthesis